MIQKINVPVLVSATYDPKVGKLFPDTIVWNGRTYAVRRIGLHHKYFDGRTRIHVFSVETPALFFKLVFNTESLSWRAEEISDGEPD